MYSILIAWVRSAENSSKLKQSFKESFLQIQNTKTLKTDTTIFLILWVIYYLTLLLKPTYMKVMSHKLILLVRGYLL